MIPTSRRLRRARTVLSVVGAWLAFLACLAAFSAHAGRDDGAPGYDVALFADGAAGEQLVVIAGPDGRRTGTSGLEAQARLLQGDELDDALRTIRRKEREDDVSVVSIDGEGEGGVEIVADDDDGDSAYIRIGSGGIVIHAGDGEDDFHLSLGHDHPIGEEAGGTVRIHARSEPDSQDRAVVLFEGMDADATRDFINDLDDVPRKLRRAMREALDL